MFRTVLIIVSSICLLGGSNSLPDDWQPRASCTVTSYSLVAKAIESCTNIVIRGITVPAGTTLELSLANGTNITLDGDIKFEYDEWEGPLVHVTGSAITIQGTEGHSLDGQGVKYWDGLGDSGKKKPIFFKIEATGGSQFKNINLVNCPRQCVSISASIDVSLLGWTIDSSDGDKLGKNTDGFVISSSYNVVIESSIVRNQDDCIGVYQGSNMQFSNISCYGGHGLSLAVGQSQTSSAANVVSNIAFTGSYVVDSKYGIHIKTYSDAAAGSVSGVTFNNIKLSGITYYGINVQEDYKNGDSTGVPNDNIPISGLTITNVYGTMTGSLSVPVYILCGKNGCLNWQWSEISITGNQQSSSCNYKPDGFPC